MSQIFLNSVSKSIKKILNTSLDLVSKPLTKPLAKISSKNNQHTGYQYIKVENSAQVTTVTLNRADKKNAMSFAMMRELISAAETIKSDKTVRAVVLQGAGEDFCAGVDLTDLNNSKSQAFALWEFIKPWQSLFQKVCLIWQSLPVPVIANIHGHCLGAGLQLIMATDIKLADKNSKLAVMEAKWGLVADMGITQSALASVNLDVLKELAMTARIITATEAKEIGLITHITDNELLKNKDDKLAILLDEIKDRSPDAVLASKRVVNSMYKQSAYTIYNEKLWQTKLVLGHNRKLALKKAKDSSLKFAKRQFK